MFTGIVEEKGQVLSFSEGKEAWKLEIRAPMVSDDLEIGDSLATNGCCLTLVEKRGDVLRFDLLDETVRLTGFSGMRAGDGVNLERSLKADGRLGGHFVSGHIDCTGEVTVFERRGKNFYLRVRVPKEFLKYLAYKASAAIDGVSLTVAEVLDDGFAVWLIPHTVEVTNLSERKVGDVLNLEFDLLAKYVERLLKGEKAL